MPFSITPTTLPGSVICQNLTTEQFFILDTASGRPPSAQALIWAESFASRTAAMDIELANEQALDPTISKAPEFLKIRRITWEDAAGSIRARVDYIHDHHAAPSRDPHMTAFMLGGDQVDSTGLRAYIEVELRPALTSSESFHPLNDHFYR